MKIILVTIGSELLNGKIQDQNVKWFSSYLSSKGHILNKAMIIPDNEDEFQKAMTQSLSEYDLIITTGGVGPTKDDKTKQMMADLFGLEIKYSDQAFDVTQKNYLRQGRSYTDKMGAYSYLPEDIKAINNPVGYAPALEYEFEKEKFIFNLPGVPKEFQHLISEELSGHFESSTKVHKLLTFKTKEIPESRIFNELCPDLWEKLSSFGEVSSLPNLISVDITVSLIADQQIEIDKQAKEIIALMERSKLQDSIWQIGSQSLEEYIVTKAREKNITIGFAESCTGGLCASRITNVSGASAVFWGSIVSYANEVKERCLNVQPSTLKEYGAVSKQTALEMAKGARQNLGVDISVSTTGIAGPSGGTEEKPVGTVGIGISTKDNSSSETFNYNGDREQLKRRFSQKALFTLLAEIENY